MNEITLRYTFIGDTEVGKTSLLHKINSNEFQNFDKTIGINNIYTDIVINDTKIKIFIWDTAGDKRFQSICTHFYKNIMVIFVVFDLTNKSSFENIYYWMNEAKHYCSPETQIVIIGTKSDLLNDKQVSDADINNFVIQTKIIYY